MNESRPAIYISCAADYAARTFIGSPVRQGHFDVACNEPLWPPLHPKR